MSTKRDRVILPMLLSIESAQANKPTFDVPSLFLHLLLFDTVIVPTVRLQEIAAIVKAVGFKQSMMLLEADCLSMRSPMDHIGTLNSPDADVCEMIYVWAPEPEKIFATYSQELSTLEIPRKNRNALRGVIEKRWIAGDKAEPYMMDAMKTAEREAIERSSTFMAALDLNLWRAALKPLTREQIFAEPINNSGRLKFRVEGETWTPDLTKAVRAATLSVAGLEAQFGHMERDNAVGGIKDDSLAIMERKVKSLWEALRPDERVEQFYRVQSIAELPNFAEWLHDPGLDMKKFLEVRQSAECREFREYLSKAGSMNDEELGARAKSIRAKIGESVKSPTGKLLRWLATTGVGLIPGAGLVLGPAASATDTFLVEKVFASTGIISFIGSQYPSIFN